MSSSASQGLNNPLANAPSSIEWLQCIELGYEQDEMERQQIQKLVCFSCGKTDEASQLSSCSKCQVVRYCSRECQIKDWKKGGHKYSCQAYKRVGRDMNVKDENDQAPARQEIFVRIRFYACPFAVYKSLELGKGFLFVQSPCTLAQMSLPTPKSSSGHAMRIQRAVMLHYLTLGEFDSELCRDDFELAIVRNTLTRAVEEYDPKSSVVLLMRFRCGHVAVGVSTLVPDYGICMSLGKEYYATHTAGVLQLNIDDS